MTPPTSALERALGSIAPLPLFFDTKDGYIYRRPDPLTRYVIAEMQTSNEYIGPALVAAVNALPALLALARRAEAAEKRVGELEAGLENIIDAANSFCDESGDEVASQVKLRARALLTPIAKGRCPSSIDGGI